MLHRYALPLTVRYADTDAQGHVFFANYLTYADEGLTGYLAAIGCSYSALEAIDLDIVYAASSCQHRGSAKFGEVLAVHTAIIRLGRTSLTTSVQVCRGADILAEIELVSVVVTRTGLSPAPVPDILRSAVARFEDRTAG